MLTLAIDTSGEFGSIALLDDAEVVDEVLLHEPAGFGGVIFDRIGDLLARNGRKLDDVDVLAAASGPGSFTGVRIGLAAVKGLGEVQGKPVAAVSTLEAVGEFSQHPLRAVVLDARRGEVYAALFDDGGPGIAESVMPFPSFLAQLGSVAGAREFEWVSTDFEPFADALAGTPFATMPVARAPRALASAIGRIAFQRAADGKVPDAALAEANYVRRSDAELLWKG